MSVSAGNTDMDNVNINNLDMKALAWAQEYLLEADKVKKYLFRLKKQKSKGEQENEADLEKRIQMIYTIYLEMSHTGGYLLRYAKRRQLQ